VTLISYFSIEINYSRHVHYADCGRCQHAAVPTTNSPHRFRMRRSRRNYCWNGGIRWAIMELCAMFLKGTCISSAVTDNAIHNQNTQQSIGTNGCIKDRGRTQQYYALDCNGCAKHTRNRGRCWPAAVPPATAPLPPNSIGKKPNETLLTGEKRRSDEVLHMMFLVRRNVWTKRHKKRN
jgi:hypothetical protein